MNQFREYEPGSPMEDARREELTRATFAAGFKLHYAVDQSTRERRERFATAALQMVMAWSHNSWLWPTAKQLAALSFEIADAMIHEADKHKAPADKLNLEVS